MEKKKFHKNSSLMTISSNIVVYDNDWQYPAKTEWAAYESIVSQDIDKDVLYIAFPWATFIDGLRNRREGIEKIFLELNYLKKLIEKSNIKNVVTVCQHILLLEFLDYFKELGITTIYWSHKVVGQDYVESINIKPFPLYPAQTEKEYFIIINENDKKELEKLVKSQKKKYLTNFIGAYNAKIYLSDVRQHIFNDYNKAGYHIIKRDQWHFERLVYSKQMQGQDAQGVKLFEEEQNTKEYLNAIKDSEFTLCPTGSGPNSIRLFESLCLGSIPVIISKKLDLPGNKNLWGKAAVIVDDSVKGYVEAKNIMENMSDGEIFSKKIAGLELIKQVGPSSYASLIFMYNQTKKEN